MAKGQVQLVEEQQAEAHREGEAREEAGEEAREGALTVRRGSSTPSDWVVDDLSRLLYSEDMYGRMACAPPQQAPAGTSRRGPLAAVPLRDTGDAAGAARIGFLIRQSFPVFQESPPMAKQSDHAKSITGSVNELLSAVSSLLGTVQHAVRPIPRSVRPRASSRGPPATSVTSPP